MKWLSETPIDFAAQTVDQTTAIVISTPCNTLNFSATFTDDAIATRDVAVTLVGCDPDRTAQENWVKNFFASNVEFERTGDELTLRNGTAEIVLAPSD